MQLKLNFSFLSIVFYISSFTVAQNIFYVSTSGSDVNSGTITEPWKTIQHAASTISAGDVVFVRGGEYNEAVTINVSGSATVGYITFQNYQNEQAIIDGTGITVPASNNGLFLIENKNYIIIKGFELRNYKTSQSNIVPSGIFITGTSHNIEIRNNKIYNIEHNRNSLTGADAHGIAVYGTSGTGSINNVIIDGNELYDLILGSSEALVLNGNVEQFTIANNIVRDANNIGIDCIGFEGTASQFDQARNGEIIDNTIYNISSYGNPAYGNVYAAGGIYVDGGKDITIDRNIIHNADIGIELASEHSGKSTNNITVRNNLIYDNNIAGIAMGGYDTNRGSTESCKVLNNTLYNNDTQQEYNGELWLQFDVKNSEIKNNIFYCNNQGVLISNTYTQSINNTFDYNLYYATSSNSFWVWPTIEYSTFSSYKTGTANDANGLFENPMFVDISTQNFHLQNSSPAKNIGNNTVDASNYDLDKETRIENGTIDLGCYEYRNTVLLQTKIFLEGCYDTNTNQITTNLNSDIPKISPYQEDPRTVDNIPNNIVDWVLVQLRTTVNGSAVISKSFLLREDGLIVNDNATSGVVTLNATEDNYYIIIKHRNHLSVMSKLPVSLNSTTSSLYNFTIGSDQFYGSGGAKQLEP